VLPIKSATVSECGCALTTPSFSYFKKSFLNVSEGSWTSFIKRPQP